MNDDIPSNMKQKKRKRCTSSTGAKSTQHIRKKSKRADRISPPNLQSMFQLCHWQLCEITVWNFIKTAFSSIEQSTIDNENSDDLEELKAKMNRELSKKTPKWWRINKLMAKTFLERREWIVSGTPAAENIMQEFPALNLVSIHA